MTLGWLSRTKVQESTGPIASMYGIFTYMYHKINFEPLRSWVGSIQPKMVSKILNVTGKDEGAIQLYETHKSFCFWMGMLGICNGLQVYKVHPWKHEALDLFRVLRNPTARNFLNPLIHICEINEDVIGRVSRLSWKKIEKWWSMSPNLPKATLGQ